MDDRHRALLDDMELALRSELGARALYPLLRRLCRDPELKRVLERLAEDERELVDRVRGLMTELGADPRKGSLRRRLAAWAVAGATLVVGLRFALRLCQDAESAVSRWYMAYRAYFAELGDRPRAEECERLAQMKTRHASWLETWVQNVPFRRL
ncbi:MAG: hypothetical protein AAF682_21840 [Planctomycetota bacterium]